MILDNIRLAIIGMGYVGLPLAVEFGKKRHVVGYDINVDRITQLQAGLDSTLEVSSDELSVAKYLEFSSKVECLKKCNCYIVTVPTPIDKHKRPDLAPILSASRLISSVLKKGDIVIYESTVYPGCTEQD